MQAARSSLANHTSIAELIKEITSMYLVLVLFFPEMCSSSGLHLFQVFVWILKTYFLFFSIFFYFIFLNKFVHVDSASEGFFDNLTVEQEFMTGVDTDKVFLITWFSHVYCSFLMGALHLMLVNPLWYLQVNTYIEDRIAQKEELIKILRLMCMQSVCNNGLKQKVLDSYKRDIFQVTTISLVLVIFLNACVMTNNRLKLFQGSFD